MGRLAKIKAALRAIGVDVGTIYNETKSFIHNSGRVYCYTDNRWVTDSDDNYGVNYYQFAESAGTGVDPIIEWEHKGILLPAGTRLGKMMFVGNSTTLEVTDLEIMVVFRQPDNISRWGSGIDADGEMVNTTIYRNFLKTPNKSIAFTGNTNDHLKRDLFLDYTLPADGFVSIYFKPVGAITSNRYYRIAYTYEVQSLFNPNA